MIMIIMLRKVTSPIIKIILIIIEARLAIIIIIGTYTAKNGVEFLVKVPME